LAWIIVTTIPFLYFLVWKAGKKLKYLSICLFGILTYGLLLTASRSGLICLIITLFATLFFEKKKIKNAIITASIILPFLLFLIGLLSPQLQDRYQSIYDPNAAGRTTWEARIKGLAEPLVELSERPLLGHGLGTSKETSYNLYRSGQISHNLYIEIIQESGLIGLIIFGMYVYSIINSLREISRRLTKETESKIWTLNLVKAIQVWVIMNLIYSISSYGFSSWEWYLFGGIAAVILKFQKKEEIKYS
jgi:O-antigen ligase